VLVQRVLSELCQAAYKLYHKSGPERFNLKGCQLLLGWDTDKAGFMPKDAGAMRWNSHERAVSSTWQCLPSIQLWSKLHAKHGKVEHQDLKSAATDASLNLGLAALKPLIFQIMKMFMTCQRHDLYVMVRLSCQSDCFVDCLLRSNAWHSCHTQSFIQR
jgi:hypothetical protein